MVWHPLVASIATKYGTSLFNPPMPVEDHSQYSLYVLGHSLQGQGVQIRVPLPHRKNESLKVHLGSRVWWAR